MTDPADADEADFRSALTRAKVPRAFERWEVVIAPGASIDSDPREWRDAIVVVTSGSVEVGCVGGSRRTFSAGDMLALSCLPVSSLHNPGVEPARLLAIRRKSRDRDPRLGSKR
jgi:hypothetical protein